MSTTEEIIELGDPLRSLRELLVGLVAIVVGLAIVFFFLVSSPEARDQEILGRAMLILFPFALIGGVPFICLLILLPGRRTNVFYLRSFKHEQSTWPIGKTIQRQLCLGYRLSGIRDHRELMAQELDRLCLDTF